MRRAALALLAAAALAGCGQRDAAPADEAIPPGTPAAPPVGATPPAVSGAVSPLAPQPIGREELAAALEPGVSCAWIDERGRTMFVAVPGDGQRAQGVLKLDGSIERVFTAGPTDFRMLHLGGPFQGEGIAVLVEREPDAPAAAGPEGAGAGGVTSWPAGLFFEAGGWAWESRQGRWLCGA